MMGGLEFQIQIMVRLQVMTALHATIGYSKTPFTCTRISPGHQGSDLVITTACLQADTWRGHRWIQYQIQGPIYQKSDDRPDHKASCRGPNLPRPLPHLNALPPALRLTTISLVRYVLFGTSRIAHNSYAVTNKYARRQRF